MKVIVTGAAGFVGFHVAAALLARGDDVLGIDSLDPYYDPALKAARLERLRAGGGALGAGAGPSGDAGEAPTGASAAGAGAGAEASRSPGPGRFAFERVDIRDRAALRAAWQVFAPDAVIHLAAQAGVRHSIEHPLPFVESNVLGFQHVIEEVRAEREQRGRTVPFIYASSSSVYGGQTDFPFRETQDVSKPISLYAATKAANELVARTYVHLYDLVCVGLRFFTVYGPFGRPDMAMFGFAERLLRGEPLPLFNHGHMVRDWTYVDDIVSGTIAALDRPIAGRVYNLGRGEPVDLLAMVRYLEEGLGAKAVLDLQPMQPGDVPKTLAAIDLARAELGYDPQVSLGEGVRRFAAWFRDWKATGR